MYSTQCFQGVSLLLLLATTSLTRYIHNDSSISISPLPLLVHRTPMLHRVALISHLAAHIRHSGLSYFLLLADSPRGRTQYDLAMHNDISHIESQVSIY